MRELIEDISGEKPPYKNSLSYSSNDWRPFETLTVSRPVQRKLTAGECVLDLDDVTSAHMHMIPAWLKATGLKFIAWKSSPTGMHVHFWTDVYGKEQKKQLVKHFAKKLESIFGVRNDALPMGHGHIRAEYSLHPKKMHEKALLLNAINIMDPINEIPASIRSKIKVPDIDITGNTRKKHGKCPTCVKYILSHQFSDGRERMLFVLVSWYKANNYDDDEIVRNCMEWCRKQNYHASAHNIKAKILSSSGKVGCTYRHALLEELGVDMERCHYE